MILPAETAEDTGSAPGCSRGHSGFRLCGPIHSEIALIYDNRDKPCFRGGENFLFALQGDAVPAKFIVTKGRSGKYGFVLAAANGATIIKSSPYETKREALTAVRYIQRNGDTETVDDRTVDALAAQRAQAPKSAATHRRTPAARTVARRGGAVRKSTTTRKSASAKSATAKAPPRKAQSRKIATKPSATRKAVSRPAASRTRKAVSRTAGSRRRMSVGSRA
ncbi:YegP family protein [Embleya scabrispora]|uniref:YegP family protein n=1 Tax=Embleya scabrispora TaxID=159449 RepID=UPI00131A21EA|nr:DUF1508 domain-containing protein [Embleya scabrispora]MYS80397.1 DUF1508 domain-containing protein [Streptomyces sp. SID5474]